MRGTDNIAGRKHQEVIMTLNYEGIALSAAALLIIGIYHPIVIKCEYYFSQKIWPVFLAVGAALVIWSLFLSGFWSPLAAYLGAVNLWCIIELKQQAERVRKGWFPRNPRRHYD